jgi:DNA adenine methylase
MKPFIKWAGGKHRFTETITDLLGRRCESYFEPFVGSGAVLLQMQPQRAYCSDVNAELINLYQIVKNNPRGLIDEIRNNFIPFHSNTFFYEVRAWDRREDYFSKYTSLQRAARFMYLNKTCYNGIWRVNKKGQNNVPLGKYDNPTIIQEETIMSAHDFFVKCNVDFQVLDYKESVNDAKKGDIAYFDPPYDKDEGQSSFVEYNQTVFGREDQIKLKELCDELVARGVTVGVSNSGTSFIKDLYKGYKIVCFDVNRTIGGTQESRHMYSEIFIYKKGR